MFSSKKTFIVVVFNLMTLVSSSASVVDSVRDDIDLLFKYFSRTVDVVKIARSLNTMPLDKLKEITRLFGKDFLPSCDIQRDTAHNLSYLIKHLDESTENSSEIKKYFDIFHTLVSSPKNTEYTFKIFHFLLDQDSIEGAKKLATAFRSQYKHLDREDEICCSLFDLICQRSKYS